MDTPSELCSCPQHVHFQHADWDKGLFPTSIARWLVVMVCVWGKVEGLIIIWNLVGNHKHLVVVNLAEILWQIKIEKNVPEKH